MNVLVVEDDIDINEGLKIALELEGFQTFSVFNGKEALSFVNSKRELDWVLLDLMMPEVDGYEFLQETYRDGKTQNFSIVIISAAPDAPQIGERFGAKVIPKPVDLTKLFAHLRNGSKIHG